MPAGAGPRIAMVKTTKKTPLSAARPPSWIRLIWTMGDTARRQVPRWRYQLTWGPEGAPRFQIPAGLEPALTRLGNECLDPLGYGIVSSSPRIRTSPHRLRRPSAVPTSEPGNGETSSAGRESNPSLRALQARA